MENLFLSQKMAKKPFLAFFLKLKPFFFNVPEVAVLRAKNFVFSHSIKGKFFTYKACKTLMHIQLA